MIEDGRVPLIVIARNRFTPISELIKYIRRHKLQHEIFIFDMQSEYPPLLELYNSVSGINIIRLENIGPRLLWHSVEFKRIALRGPFFLTDGDIDFSKTSPRVFEELINTSRRFPGFRKIGSALRIDDLPVNLTKTSNIIDSESDNWRDYRKLGRQIYMAPIDTTFAYYPKYTDDFYHWPALRVAGKYSVRHMPWYVDYENLDSESLFYIDHAKIWGTHGTSSERGRREVDIDPRKTRIYKYSLLIRTVLWLFPKTGSMAFQFLIDKFNIDSKIK